VINVYDLDKRAETDIKEIAKKCGIKKVILFGSRARGDNSRVSDIDLAVSGGDKASFRFDTDEKAHTLLMFDIVDLDRRINDDLRRETERDGVVLYEEV